MVICKSLILHEEVTDLLVQRIRSPSIFLSEPLLDPSSWYNRWNNQRGKAQWMARYCYTIRERALLYRSSLGILGIYLFGLNLGWLPIQGYTSPFDDLGKSIKQLVMPVICLGFPFLAVIARQTRSSMLEVIRQDYIRTAQSKGLRETAIIYRHALKNALIPILTMVGMHIRVLIGGSVLVETVFNISGMGRLLVLGAFNKDFLIVQGCIIIMSLITCLSNLAVDVSYGWIDRKYNTSEIELGRE
jgi:ABC-type dipeptide/oligopeptide/nickel transport system permease component